MSTAKNDIDSRMQQLEQAQQLILNALKAEGESKDAMAEMIERLAQQVNQLQREIQILRSKK